MQNDQQTSMSKQEIFVENNIIKITRIVVFNDLRPGNEETRNVRQSHNQLCPAEMVSAAQRGVYGLASSCKIQSITLSAVI